MTSFPKNFRDFNRSICSHILSLLLLAPCLLLPDRESQAAVPRDFAIDLQAEVSSSAPHIVLSWSLRLPDNISAQKVHRRLKGETVWVKLADLTADQTSYSDATAVTGVEYEYWMERTITGFSPTTAMGYISAGVDLPIVEGRGILLLVVDDTMEAPLAPEIAQLKQDLIGDGWTVQQITATRADANPVGTKALIKAAYDADPTNVKMVYILGHVPVPYSGNIAPDGHGSHRGAWPSDGFYGDMDGVWTDTSVNATGASGTRNDNVPGDGKYDQGTLPSLLELQVGRVDLHSMTRAPSSAASEVELLRRYLRKTHDFRYKQGAYANIARRGLIRDGFRYFGGENFAMSGWAWAFSGAAVPPAATVIDEAPTYEWFTPSYASGNTYLIGEANGGGSHEFANGFGTSSELGSKASKVVFTSFFGSIHGDWDGNNNLMRASLAGNATGDSLGLCGFWAGRPHYYMHHMGMGETLGYSIRASQNGLIAGGGNYTPGGYSSRGVHTGTMGDPALRLHVVEPPRGFGANSANSEVSLRWNASSESALVGYHVYRSDSPTGPFTRLTSTPLATNTYTDSTITVGNSYTYLTRTVITETAAGGTYQNQSHSAFATITASSAAIAVPFGPSELTLVSQASSVNAQISWSDNSTDETGFSIERKTNAVGVWGPLSTTAANATSFTDAGPFTQDNVYYYRVAAIGTAGESLPSNEMSFDAVAGYFNLSGTIMKLDKSAGNAVISVERFGGGVGAVQVNYATANSSAIAGTHYTASSDTLSWVDGEQGIKTISVPITNTASPQLPRQFRLSLSNPTGGTGIGTTSRIAVLIEDSSATLSASWSQTLFGSTSTATMADVSPAVEAEGTIGSAIIGGSGVSTSSSEAGRFVYQSRSGDGSMTMFVPTPTPSQSNARFAVMVRESTATNSAMAASVTSGNASGYGAKLAYRATTGASGKLIPSAHNDFRTPRWVRITRAGDTFTAEASEDGSIWTILGSSQVVIPDSALWGVFHYSQNWARSSTYLGDYQLATFDNISFGDLPLPTAPADLSASYVDSGSPYVQLTWTNPLYANEFKIERRLEGGSFEEIAAPAAGTIGSYQDTLIDPNVAYQYRIRSLNPSGESDWSESVSVISPPADTVITVTAVDGADAMVRFDNPTTAYGTSDSLTVAGTEIGTGALTPVSKAWMRFDMTGVVAPKSLTLKLKVVSQNIQPSIDSQGVYASQLLMLPEASDIWDESTINFSNAPQNDTAGLSLTGTTHPMNYLVIYASPLPSPGDEITIELNASVYSDNVGANGLLTLALIPYLESGPITYASAEHATYAPPTIEITQVSALSRPSFLTATSSDPSGIALSWADGSDDETGFRIERRIATDADTGTFATLQDVAADTTAFFDATALPAIAYEYRVRAIGPPGDSSWSASATAYIEMTYQLWLQSYGLPIDESGAGAPNAQPAHDGIDNLAKYGLGLNPLVPGYQGRISFGLVKISGINYLTFTYTRPEPAPTGITYTVKAGGDLKNWSASGLIETANTLNNGLRTITIRDAVPSDSRFMKLEVSRP